MHPPITLLPQQALTKPNGGDIQTGTSMWHCQPDGTARGRRDAWKNVPDPLHQRHNYLGRKPTCPRNRLHQRENKAPRHIPYRAWTKSTQLEHRSQQPDPYRSGKQVAIPHRHVPALSQTKHAPTKNEHHLNANTRHRPAHPGAYSFNNQRTTKQRARDTQQGNPQQATQLVTQDKRRRE